MQNRPHTSQAHRMPQQLENQQTSFPTGPVNVFGKSALNTQFGNASNPNKNQQFINNNNFFGSTGPRDIIVEELHNIEKPSNSTEFNEESHEYDFESELFDPRNPYYENETAEENVQLIASEEPPLT
ncbi:hypothetical protein Trydic_g2024 [Trypoxylus dichotomus]